MNLLSQLEMFHAGRSSTSLLIEVPDVLIQQRSECLVRHQFEPTLCRDDTAALRVFNMNAGNRVDFVYSQTHDSYPTGLPSLNLPDGLLDCAFIQALSSGVCLGRPQYHVHPQPS